MNNVVKVLCLGLFVFGLLTLLDRPSPEEIGEAVVRAQRNHELRLQEARFAREGKPAALAPLVTATPDPQPQFDRYGNPITR